MKRTIYALASAPGKAGVSVVRVSGPQARHSLEALSGRNHFERRKFYYEKLRDPVSRETIDRAVVLYFEAPHSYTGEDVAEYHIHGSMPVLESLLRALAAQPNHLMAGPGEFTRRAFENGRMDLTEAEAVADLIAAQTQLQKAQALRQIDGGLRQLYERWTHELKKMLAHMEADLEFPDEDDPQGVFEQSQQRIAGIAKEIEGHLQQGRRGERLREGIQIAVLGAPNAGKSSLVNTLAQREVAIVSDLAGTTRDVIEVHLDLEGYPVTLLDMAGLRELAEQSAGHEALEREGIRRALRRAEEADIALLLFDGGLAEPDPMTLAQMDDRALVVITKADEPVGIDYEAPALRVSAQSGKGLDELIRRITERCAGLAGRGDGLAPTRMRHREALMLALDDLRRSEAAALPELMAEDVRLAVRHIGQITGRVDVEDILDIVFRDFCIGK